MTDPEDFYQLEGRGGATLLTIIVIAAWCIASGAVAGWIGRGIWG